MTTALPAMEPVDGVGLALVEHVLGFFFFLVGLAAIREWSRRCRVGDAPGSGPDHYWHDHGLTSSLVRAASVVVPAQ